MSKPVFEDLFRFAGRRNRKSYALYALLLIVILGLVWGVAIALTGNDEYTMMVIAGIISVAAGVSSWAVGAQRCRDFGWTGWAVLLTLIPYLGVVFSLAILFVPGNIGPNRYGPDPLGNHVNDWPT